ncbi:ribokinase [Microlunatus elymi]|uniref:Ribokinase n=1 Tax=Microlunatus elymi TaxID=2596828 RepID=A0A516Q340_9ACTN|nr:ribokinase [Microlunatus elymi]QDP97840.1 ribokinase [Microlunatus elymi]
MTSNVIVVGSANQDYVIDSTGLPEPGETRLANGMKKLTGGKGANQAVAAARLGAAVHFVGAIGDDDDGRRMITALRDEGIDTEAVEVTDEPTGLALVNVLPGGENAITVVPGANFTVTADRAAEEVRRLAASGGVLVVQAEIPVNTIGAAVAAADEAGLRPVINLAPYTQLPDEVLALADPLVVNEVEAADMIGRIIRDIPEVLEAAAELVGRARSVVITLGGAGACWATADDSGHVAPPPVDEVVDTTGAGDAFVGGLARQLAESADLAAAVRYGVAVGTFAVTRAGAQPSYPTPEELEGALSA